MPKPTRKASTSKPDGDLATGSTAPRPSENQTIEAALGAQVRKLRQRAGLTLADLSGQSGLSSGMLSKIETGSISPSLATLQALSTALGVPVASLFESYDERRDVSYVPAGRGVVIERRGTKAGHTYELLGHSLAGDLVVEPFMITLAEGAMTYPNFRHEGVEFIYMLEGEVGYRHGDKVFPLKPGDALLFDPQAAHGPENLDALPARYLSVIIHKRG